MKGMVSQKVRGGQSGKGQAYRHMLGGRSTRTKGNWGGGKKKKKEKPLGGDRERGPEWRPLSRVEHTMQEKKRGEGAGGPEKKKRSETPRAHSVKIGPQQRKKGNPGWHYREMVPRRGKKGGSVKKVLRAKNISKERIKKFGREKNSIQIGVN